MYVPFPLLSAIEAAVNAVLRLDPATQSQLAALTGKCIAIELQNLNWQLYVKPMPAGIRLTTSCDPAPDATLIGSPITMLRMAAAPADSTLLFRGDIQIRGDIELGRRIKSLLQGLDLDWEELLSRYVGDILARPLGNSLRSLKGWSQYAIHTIEQDLAEYLREEARLLPDRGEIAAYLDAVDYLRADLERLEARVQRLRQQP